VFLMRPLRWLRCQFLLLVRKSIDKGEELSNRRDSFATPKVEQHRPRHFGDTADEMVIFLMRQFGWTFEYAVHLVTTLETGRLNALIREAEYQQAVDDYRTACNFGMLIANWASAQGKRRYRVNQFVGNKPRRLPLTPEQVDLQRDLVFKRFAATFMKGGQDGGQAVAGNQSNDQAG